MCALRIVQHLTKIYFHDLKSDYEFNDQLKNITNLRSDSFPKKEDTSQKSFLPNRDALSELMAQLPASNFPELIEQILIQNYNHARGDITDGPGDQSRDIHTITPEGNKHLTQCRHTENPHKSNLNHHDLDELWAATGRLNYQHGLLVTNADMTAPAKASYVNGEYTREGRPELGVWNGRNLWDEISKNQDILNRWFSGLAQLHSVKRFSFRVLPVKMPQREPAEIKDCVDGFIAKLRKQGFAIGRSGESWKFENGNLIIFMRKWFSSAANLFMPCSLKASYDLVTAPFSILEFHVINKTNEFDYDGIRDFLGFKLLKTFKNKDGFWTTLLVSPLMAPVYIHDTQNVIVSGIKPYTSFVSVNDECFEELNAAFSFPDAFTMQNDDGLEFIHNDSDILFTVNYSQPIYEGGDDTLKVIKFKVQKAFRKSIVFEVDYDSDFEFSMALASVNIDHPVFEDPDDKKLFFCFTKGEDDEDVKADLKVFIQSLKASDINYRVLEPNDLVKMNERLQNELQFEARTEKACHSRRELVAPIDLQSRVITSFAEVDISNFAGEFYELAFELFKYKMREQQLIGFDEGFKEGNNQITARQLRNILWRPTKMTGIESINIGIRSSSEPMSLLIYFKPNRLEVLSEALRSCLARTLKHIENISMIIKESQN